MKISELIQPELTQNQGYQELGRFTHEDLTFYASTHGKGDLAVTVDDANGNQIANALFEVNEDGDTVSSQDTWVHQQFRGRGIATLMYNWAQRLGNTVVKSKTLSRAGKKFWKAREQK